MVFPFKLRTFVFEILWGNVIIKKKEILTLTSRTTSSRPLNLDLDTIFLLFGFRMDSVSKVWKWHFHDKKIIQFINTEIAKKYILIYLFICIVPYKMLLILRVILHIQKGNRTNKTVFIYQQCTMKLIRNHQL